MNIQPIGTAGIAATQSAQLPSPPVMVDAVPPTVASSTAMPSQQQPSAAQLTQAVASINEAMQKLAPGLEFSIDQESNRTIVKVIDQQTKELIRQMPSAETLEIAKALDRVQGLLISLSA